MINLLSLLFILALLGAGASWLAENPGAVTVHFGNWRVDTSLAVVLGAAVLAVPLLFAPLDLLARRDIKKLVQQCEAREPQVRDQRLVIVTDMGLIAKRAADGTREVFVQSIASGLPVAGHTSGAR